MGLDKLRAVVVGAGWAGEGHVKALQHNGVEVVAICARTKDVVQKVASNLGVANASVDWRQTLQTMKPDIVALATPAVLRREVIELAAQLGCHLLCEKPLATTSEEARQLYTMVANANIKHACAVTLTYDPGVTWMAELLANDTIGPLQEVDLSFKFPYFNASTPWSWIDSLSLGGGALNNGLPHFLGGLEKMLAGKMKAVVGESRVLRKTACYKPDLHDYRQVVSTELSEAEAATLEWRECDADNAFSALLQFETRLSGKQGLIPVMIHINFDAPLSAPTNGWYFYGEKGVLVNEELWSVSITKHSELGIEPLPIPPRLTAHIPQNEDDAQLKWFALTKEFVADIRSEPHSSYLTFEDGWRYQEAVDAIRFNKGWHQLATSI